MQPNPAEVERLSLERGPSDRETRSMPPPPAETERETSSSRPAHRDPPSPPPHPAEGEREAPAGWASLARIGSPAEAIANLVRSLRASEEAFRRLIECNADGVLVMRPTGEIVYGNPAAERLLGRPLQQLLGQPFGLPVGPGETTEIDILHQPTEGHPFGPLRIAEMRSQSIEWQGQPAILASLRDITERKQAEVSLRILAEASQELAQSLDEPTTLLTISRLTLTHLGNGCRIDRLSSNGRLYPILCSHNDPAIQETWNRLLSPEGADLEVNEVPAIVVRTGKPYVFPAIPHTSSAVATPEMHPPCFLETGVRAYFCFPLVVRGRTIGTLTVAHTEPGPMATAADFHLIAEFTLRAAAAMENARLYRESQEENRRKAEFLAMLGHELRNPLSAIRTAAALLEHPTGSVQQAAQVVSRQVRHMNRLVDDLLEVSRVSRGLIQLRCERVVLYEILIQSLESLRSEIDRRKLQLQFGPIDESLVVDGDPMRLEQVFSNLLHNATKYTDPGGHIRVSVERDENFALVRIEDSGIGIPPEIQPRLFEIFSTAPQTLDRSRGGLGIGLTLVRKLVELHGGDVQVHSPGVGQGSRFTVRLPLPLTSGTNPASSIPQATSNHVQGTPKSILLIEDAVDAREMLELLLRSWGHRVQSADNGRVGFEQALKHRPEIAIIDIGLPEWTGYEVARRIRAELSLRSMLLIALTGYGQPEDTRAALAAGFDRHLVKPVDLDQLAELLQDGVPPRSSASS